jgi:carboxypeptidase C (cathepsin A)
MHFTTLQIVRLLPFLYFDIANHVKAVRPVLSELSSVVQSGVQTVLYAGDADCVCDWFGGFASANAIEYSGQVRFQSTQVINYTVNGEVKGTFKTEGKLSWLRVFNSGHQVPSFQPELALQVFIQTMQKKTLFST